MFKNGYFKINVCNTVKQSKTYPLANKTVNNYYLINEVQIIGYFKNNCDKAYYEQLFEDFVFFSRDVSAFSSRISPDNDYKIVFLEGGLNIHRRVRPHS